jgi:hypothetical protein
MVPLNSTIEKTHTVQTEDEHFIETAETHELNGRSRSVNGQLMQGTTCWLSGFSRVDVDDSTRGTVTALGSFASLLFIQVASTIALC